jgi:hypothetical protein
MSFSQQATQQVKKNMKTFVPVRQQQKTAEQRKNDELYGKTVVAKGINKKADGSLMADCADWRNPQQTYTNSPLKKSHSDALYTPQYNAKDRKYINLESKVVLGDNVKDRISDKPEYNNNLTKATFGTIAHWSTLAAANKLNNKPQKVDTYKKRQ